MNLGNCDALQAEWPATTLERGIPFSRGQCHMYGHGAVIVGRTVFVLGGYYDTRKASFLYSYDIPAAAWRAYKVGQPEYAEGAVFGRAKLVFVHNDNIFAYIWRDGARDGRMFSLNCVLKDGWRSVGNTSEYGSYTTYVGAFHEQREEAFLCNGVRVVKFVPATERWKELSTKGLKSGAVNSHACCATPSSLIVSGGAEIQTPLVLRVLDLQRLNWSILKPTKAYCPPRRYLFTLSYVNGRIIAFGGYNRSKQMDIFSMEERKWYSVVSGEKLVQDRFPFYGTLLSGTREHAAVVTMDKMIVFGGFGDDFQLENPLVIRPR